ncbi:MAG: hypothetical protein HFF31_08370 [Flavonifractor sp.]|nr:hypothetical protein [Flavonifractor sp.]
MNGLQVFSYNSSEVRTVMRDGEPWFCLVDVCRVLDLSSPHKVAERLDRDELTGIKVRSGGQTREMTFINESGLYSVILRSDKPEAKPFRKWVTSEVLPTIRKTGGYGVDGTKAALAEAKLNNSRARVASAWMKISKENPVSGYKQVCAHYASAALAGREVLPLPDTECCAVAGKDAASAWAVMDELMETLRVVKQRTYDSVMRKMERL